MTEIITTKEAKDGAEFEAYPTYSMAVLWSMKALTPEEFADAAVSETPLDGDAQASSRYRELRLAEAWDKLNAAAIGKLKNNHAAIDRNNR